MSTENAKTAHWEERVDSGAAPTLTRLVVVGDNDSVGVVAAAGSADGSILVASNAIGVVVGDATGTGRAIAIGASVVVV
jgi:hypothetical protein